MRPTLQSNRRYIILDRATMQPCSTYLCGDNKGMPVIYEYRELFGVKVVFKRMGIEAVEREIGGEE